METVFKKGDKVYCVLYGWGRVLGVDDVGTYPVTVLFDCDEEIDYTVDGKLYDDSFPILSFTEYTLQGFSQERQIELPEVGEDVLVFDEEEHSWVLKQFKQYEKYSEYPFIVTDKLSFLVYQYAKMKRIKILD
jgi:hypothetical protein